MKKILILLLIAPSLYAQQVLDFAIYHDGDVGAWEESVIAFEHFLDWKGQSHQRISAQDINTISLQEHYKAIFFPGGDADYYTADINTYGIQNIQTLISNGGAYVGMCAGAEFACDKLVWQGDTYDYPLDLFEGKALGPIDQLAPWPDYTMARLSMNLSDEINQYETPKEDMLYWGGTVFAAYANADIDTLATYDDYFQQPAIIKFNYGNGRVLLISPHPEIEEDSARDGVAVAQELEDNGSDWNFLWTATDWLLGEPLSSPITPTAYIQPEEAVFQVFPNPAKDILNMAWIDEQAAIEKCVLYNSVGQVVLVLYSLPKALDISQLPNGIYIIEMKSKDQLIRKKILLLK